MPRGGGEWYEGQEGFICACSVPILFPGYLLWLMPEMDMTQCHHSEPHSPVVPSYFTAGIMKTEAFRQFLFQSSQRSWYLCD